MLDGAPGVEEFAAVGKAVWGDIEHAHDERARAKHERARREFELEFFTPRHRESSLARRAKKKITQRRRERGGFAEKKIVEVEVADGLSDGSVRGRADGLVNCLGQ